MEGNALNGQKKTVTFNCEKCELAWNATHQDLNTWLPVWQSMSRKVLTQLTRHHRLSPFWKSGNKQHKTLLRTLIHFSVSVWADCSKDSVWKSNMGYCFNHMYGGSLVSFLNRIVSRYHSDISPPNMLHFLKGEFPQLHAPHPKQCFKTTSMKIQIIWGRAAKNEVHFSDLCRPHSPLLQAADYISHY